MTARILIGDVREQLRTLPDESVQCVITSPPYWGLRDYGVDGQIGLEASPDEHVAVLVDVFREVRRVLRSDGTLWLNYGDCYATSVNGRSAADTKAAGGDDRTFRDKPFSTVVGGLKPKDLVGMPWRVAFALQAGGWWLRSDIIWAKPNPMPESVKDRPARAHEYVFLLTKSARYFYDNDAVRRPAAPSSVARLAQDVENQKGSTRAHAGGKVNGPMKAVQKRDKQRGHGRRHNGFNDRWDAMSKAEQRAMGANLRDVWDIATVPFSEAHFATFPPALVEPCLLAGSRLGDVILDPFGGSGTVGLVAERFGRNSILIELNPEYAAIAENRIRSGLGRVDGGSEPPAFERVG